MIRKIFTTLLLSLAILWLLEKAAEWGLVGNVNFKTTYIRSHPREADMIILGPCEPEWMMDPKIIDSVIGTTHTYNLSLNHSDFADNYLHLHLYLKHHPRPKQLFLFVTPESFDSTIANVFNSYRFVLDLQDDTVRETVRHMDPSYFRASHIPYMKFSYFNNFMLFKILNGIYHRISDRSSQYPDGYAPVSRGRNAVTEGFRDLNPEKGRFLWHTTRELYFRKLIRLAKEQNIPIALYESPVFAGALPRESNRPQQSDRIRDISTAEGIPYLVFDTLPMNRDRKYFFSTLNTTYEGSCMFSGIFARRVRGLIDSTRATINGKE